MKTKKKFAVALLILLSLTAFACSQDMETTVRTTGKWVVVNKVIDGDTFVIDTGERVRLLSVNCPETRKGTTKAMPYGEAAKRFTKEQLLGQSIYLTFDQKKKDKYDRLLAYAFFKEPRDDANLEENLFNAILIKRGLAQVYSSEPNIRYLAILRQLQKKAKNEKVGIWSLDIYKDEVQSSQKVFKE